MRHPAVHFKYSVPGLPFAGGVARWSEHNRWWLSRSLYGRGKGVSSPSDSSVGVVGGGVARPAVRFAE
jgi:hypothetical protein